MQTIGKPPFEIVIILATTEVLKEYKPHLSKNIVSKIIVFVQTTGKPCYDNICHDRSTKAIQTTSFLSKNIVCLKSTDSCELAVKFSFLCQMIYLKFKLFLFVFGERWGQNYIDQALFFHKILIGQNQL